MNKWSTSLPSIISLCNDVRYQLDPMFTQQVASTNTTPTSTSSSNKNIYTNGGSFTDLSMLVQSQEPFMHYDEFTKKLVESTKPSTSMYDSSPEHETTSNTDSSMHDHYIRDDELVQSLVAYADSFNLDNSSVYSIQDEKPRSGATTAGTTPTSAILTPPRRRTQSSTHHITSMIQNDPLTRHKSCDDLSIPCSLSSTSRPITVIQREEHMMRKNPTKFVPSESHPQFLFAAKSNRDNNHNSDNININNHFEEHHEQKPIEDGTTVTDCSKFEWGFSSNNTNEFNIMPTKSFHNYEATTNIGDINVSYLKDLEHCSSMAALADYPNDTPEPIPSPPVVLRKKSKDFVLKQKVDIQLLRPPTPPPPAPIIIREVRHKPPLPRRPMTIHQTLEKSGRIQFSKTPSPIIIRERPPRPPRNESSSKPTIVYRHVLSQSPSPPTVIVERLRPNHSTVIQKPAPILVEKWLPYPPEQQRKIIYERASPVQMRNKRRTHERPKTIFVEYDDVNVIVNKDIKQRQEIKRVRPDEYLHQYGNSLYSNDTLNQILNDFSCAAQV